MSHADKIAAFFDLDGTLLPEPSLERRFLLYLLMHKRIGPVQLAQCVVNFVHNIATNPSAAIQANKSYSAGVPTSCAEAWSARFASHPQRLFCAGLRVLESHFAQGHRVFIVTGAPAPLAEVIDKFLPVPAAIVATQLDRDCALHRLLHLCSLARRESALLTSLDRNGAPLRWFLPASH